ncbi:MAG: epoxyqueuosine reductase QueH, partial [Acholeplasmatales bacterium]|nr:epoxyqueuosine reductase QueH [Acholeplasmatales bacterium]
MRIDDYKSFLKFIKSLDKKPKLLLHACCAPCSSHCIMILKKYFDITIFYSNDNIYPKEEFDYRLDEINRFMKDLNLGIPVLSDGYNSLDYDNIVKGYEALG